MADVMKDANTGAGDAAPRSVWDFPEQPGWEDFHDQVQVVFNELVVADSRQSVRLIERGQAPVYFIPQQDVMMRCLRKNGRTRQHAVMGDARLFTLKVGERAAEDAAWAYLEPQAPYVRVKEYIAFDPNLVDACLVNGEAVTPQQGGNRGWVTQAVVGPFAGDPGSE